MKKTLLLLFLFFNASILFAQKIDTFRTNTTNGVIVQVMNQKNGLLAQWIEINHQKDGLAVYYSDNKMPLQITTFSKDKKNGVELNFNREGKILDSKNFENNKLNGLSIEYFPNIAKVKSEIYYSDGIENGFKKLFFDNGNLQENGRMKMGKKDGTYTWYFLNGKKASEQEFINGIQEGFTVNYDEDGNTISMGKYVNGVKKGKWKEFKFAGKHVEEGEYDKDYKVGKWIKKTDTDVVLDIFYFDKNGKEYKKKIDD